MDDDKGCEEDGDVVVVVGVVVDGMGVDGCLLCTVAAASCRFLCFLFV